jgi:superfamily II DNA helicase RecQ
LFSKGRKITFNMEFVTRRLIVIPQRQRARKRRKALHKPKSSRELRMLGAEYTSITVAEAFRVRVEYSVVWVKNGRGATEVQKLVESRVAGHAPGEKGVIYCNSHMKYKVLAQRLGFHYYHGNPEDSNAHFVA